MKKLERLTLLIFLAVIFGALPSFAGDVEKSPFGIGEWLVLGPLAAPTPVFETAPEDLLDAISLPSLLTMPLPGTAVEGFDAEYAWQLIRSADDGSVVLDAPTRSTETGSSIVWLSSTLRTRHFVAAQLEVDCDHPSRVYIDGREVEAGEINLETGDHVVFVVSTFDPDANTPWQIAVSLVGDSLQGVAADIDQTRDLSILDVLDVPSVVSFDLSPGGERMVLTQTRVRPGTALPDRWVELRSTKDGALLETWPGSPDMHEVRFTPTGNRISFVTRDQKEETASLWVVDLGSGAARELVSGIENWAGYRWSPTGDTVIFSTTEEPEKDESGIKRLRGLLDRMAGHRNLTRLHQVSVSSGIQRRLTGGTVSSSVAAFSPDGKRLLVTREVEDLSRRPYSRQELWEIGLATGKAEKLRDFRWLSGVQFAPDGRRLLILAGPGEFGGAGIVVDGDGPVNDFDGQLFIWDPVTDSVKSITREFDPSVTRAVWNRHDGMIYLLAVDGHYRRVFSFEPETGSMSRVETEIESVDSFEVARANSALVLSGTSVWQPQKLAVVDGPGEVARVLLEPGEERFANVRRGEVRRWDFTATDGRTVVGRVYLPPSFDSAERYPGIVNYYGGTAPMTRSFGGRYPAEWWAATGYVVYVLTPTGAYGWGQENSSVHVNDWGEVTSRQIIEATTAFLEAHPFVDPHRVGSIGASYGGFMTMKLVTETDIFAAAVAHAGISALTSYWGEGYWGYSYGAVANAESFPWNRRDIFVDRSPLFHADKVTTPVLLTHGDEDPNVPPGESDQFYAALKLLGVEVEYLRVAGLGHLIMEHDKRLLWSKSVVAWFDRWLRNESEWWEALYPGE